MDGVTDRRLRRTDDVVHFLDAVCSATKSDAMPRGYGSFALAYRRMTLQMIARIPTVEDPVWMSSFVVSFADRYRAALANPGRSARPWREAFRQARERPDRPLRNLLLGINAHMAYDLAITLADSALDDPERRRADYISVNAGLLEAIDPVQSSVASIHGCWLRWADWLAGPIDEHVSLSWFHAVRARAWGDGVAIRSGARTRGSVERRVARQARRIGLLPL